MSGCVRACVCVWLKVSVLIYQTDFQIVKEGKKRKLVINGAKLEDAGKITCKSNADEASAPLGVKCTFGIFLVRPIYTCRLSLVTKKLVAK